MIYFSNFFLVWINCIAITYAQWYTTGFANISGFLLKNILCTF